jgi:hypothetical protein
MKRSYVKSTPQFSIKVSPVHKGVYPVFNQYGVQAWAYFGGPKRGWNSKIRKSRGVPLRTKVISGCRRSSLPSWALRPGKVALANESLGSLRSGLGCWISCRTNLATEGRCK